jgi:hypothetical protein
MSEQDPQPSVTGAVNRDQPWLGLDSFSEETRAWFYGREDEVAELARRIQRKTLTILFGQSGLGKTSILRAGLAPRLRPEGYCPVYVRISYAEDAPPAAEQIKRAIQRATTASGSWTRDGVGGSEDSLWEFLHHRDDSLLDAQGRPLIPLLIFDQFEEVFTLAQTDDAGKQRAARFLGELADLAENRPPQSVEARIDADEAFAEQFDFARNDYRILLALREDYLAHLEGLRAIMPSVTQNRMRLARMTGSQAFSAVIKPGGHLASEEVAQAIVRFVAGGVELANAEVEPSLLSLICRELNSNRIAQGRGEISTELLAGSHAGILSEFYQRALQDMPDGVHVVIEDDLLTEGGYRENLAEERVLNAFAAAGATPDALPILVNRRLLRIEERLDVRRVELTHDVLCSVVKAAREQRHERLAKESAQAQVQRQEEEQRRTRLQLRRTRQVAAGCLALAVIAIGAGVYGYVSAHRAEQTRGEAEKLVGYLLDDFYDELRPVGRLDLVGELGARAVAYYKGLPGAMRNAETERNRAKALIRLGSVQFQLGKNKEAEALQAEALAMFRQNFANGDQSEASRLELAQAVLIRSNMDTANGDIPKGMAMAQQAADILRPLATAGNASPALRRRYAASLTRLGWCQLRTGKVELAIATLKNAQTAVSSEASLKDDMRGTVVYIDASSWLYEALVRSEHPSVEAEQVYAQAMAAIEQVLARRPGHFQALASQSHMLSNFSDALMTQGRAGEAIRIVAQEAAIEEALLRVDPKSEGSYDTVAIAYLRQVVPNWRAGQQGEALKAGHHALAMYDHRHVDAYQSLNLKMLTSWLATLHAELGQRESALKSMQLMHKYAELSTSADKRLNQIAMLDFEIQEVDAKRRLGEAVTLDESSALRARVDGFFKSFPDKDEQSDWLETVSWLLDTQLALQYGDYARAERSAGNARKVESALPVYDLLHKEDITLSHAFALAHLHRNEEAQTLAASIIASRRKLLANGADDQYVRVELAAALLASALSKPEVRSVQLSEAQGLLNSLPREVQNTQTVKTWKSRVAAALKAGG